MLIFWKYLRKNIIVETVLEQSELSLKINTPLDVNTVILDRLEGFEGLSMPFEFALQLHSSKKAHLTQAELAEKTGTKKSYISRIENGHADIQLSTLYKLIEQGLNKRLELAII